MAITTIIFDDCDLVQSKRITLTGIGSITLRSPTFGNKNSLNVRRVQANSRGGDLIMFRDKNKWAADETIEYEFEAMDQTIRLLQTFHNQNLGKLITVTDFENNTIRGIITADPEIKQTGRGCQFTATLSFQRLF